MPTVSKSYIFKKHFVGLPTTDDFEVVETTLPPVADEGKNE